MSFSMPFNSIFNRKSEPTLNLRQVASELDKQSKAIEQLAVAVEKQSIVLDRLVNLLGD